MTGKILEGRYKVEKRIGKGGFASVYRGFDQKLKRQVAIKILDDRGSDRAVKPRFLREAESMANLSHPNIVTVYDYGDHNGLPFLVMELVNGPSLKRLIDSATINTLQVCRFAVEICSAMAYAHSHGVVHRDLSLGNIMVNEENDIQQIKILDFGLAKLLHTDASSLIETIQADVESTTTGKAVMGTPTYMAPEQVRGQSIDGRVDVFAFGVCLYRLLNGRFPFEAEHPTALMYMIVNESVTDFDAAVPNVIRDIILRCLEKDPRLRPADFTTLAEEFGALKEAMEKSDGDSSISFSEITAFADRSSKRNPYLNRVMIQHPSDFYGREKEVRKIYSRLDAPHPQSVSVVGERRIGKSSLLNFLYHRKNRRKHMQNNRNAIFAFLDCQHGVDFDVPKFIDFLFNMFTLESKSGHDYTIREKTLDQLKEVVQELHDEGKRMVLLMDEFETITRNEHFDQRFFSFLRSLANSYHVAYVTSSLGELQHMCHNKDISDSPFFNIFSNLPLRTFSLKEAHELVTSPSDIEGVPLKPYADKIIDLAGCFPFYLQIACSSVFEHMLDHEGKEPDWKEITEAFNEEVLPYYRSVWEKMDEAERDNLEKLASGKPTNKKFRYVNEILTRRGYLVESGGRLALCSTSFAQFVLEQTGKGGAKRGFLGGLFGKRRA